MTAVGGPLQLAHAQGRTSGAGNVGLSHRKAIGHSFVQSGCRPIGAHAAQADRAEEAVQGIGGLVKPAEMLHEKSSDH